MNAERKVPPQQSVSRILFPACACLSASFGEVTIIPLGPALLTGSSDLPGSFGRAVLSSAFARLRELRRDIASLFGLAPCGVLPATDVTAGAVRSYRTFSPLPAFALGSLGLGLRRGRLPYRPGQAESLPSRSLRPEGPKAKAGGMFSVPLSVGSPRPGITRRTALRSSDFPPAFAFGYGGQARPRAVSPRTTPPANQQAPKDLPAAARSAKAGDRLAHCGGTGAL